MRLSVLKICPFGKKLTIFLDAKRVKSEKTSEEGLFRSSIKPLTMFLKVQTFLVTLTLI